MENIYLTSPGFVFDCVCLYVRVCMYACVETRQIATTKCLPIILVPHARTRICRRALHYYNVACVYLFARLSVKFRFFFLFIHAHSVDV